MGLFQDNEKRLITPADGKILRPEEHVVDNPKHRPHNSRQYLRRKARHVEYCEWLVMAYP